MKAMHVEIWDAINEYVRTCGGDPSAKTISAERMDAVVKVNKAIELDQRRAYSWLDDALNSGNGTYRP